MEDNYDASCVAFITSMKEMLKQIPLTTIKVLTPKQIQKLMTEIGGGWYMGEIDKGLPPQTRSSLNKKAQYKDGEKIYIYRFLYN